MIISSLRAQNVLKYSHLVLNDIPDKGLIAISGRNESGKTAIVETICFALFGRTFSVPEDRLQKVIHWNENQCQVELVFRARDDKEYRIERSLDYKGTHAAQLYRLGEDEPMVSGPHSVEESIYEICGFDFTQYLDALYLAQREISTPHSQSDTIRAIAGATDLEGVLTDLGQETSHEQERIEDLAQDIDALLSQIRQLEINETNMEMLETERRACNDQIRETEAAISQLDQSADDIQASCPKVQSAGKSIATAGLNTSLGQWSGMVDEMTIQMEAMRVSCANIETDSDLCAEHSDLNRFVNELGERLDAFEDVQDRMDSYRVQLGALLGEKDASNDELSSEKPLPVQRREIGQKITGLQLQNMLWLILMVAGIGAAIFFALGWWQISGDASSSSAIWFNDRLTWLANLWPGELINALQMSAVLATILAGIMMFLSIGASRRARKLTLRKNDLQARLEDVQARAHLIDEADNLPFPELVEGLQHLSNEGISKLLDSYTRGMGEPFSSQLALSTEQDRLIDLLNGCMNSVGDLRESIATAIGRHRRIIEEAQERMQAIEGEKETMREREREIQTLRDQIDELSAQTQSHKDHISTLETGQYLLRETCRNIYSRFNQVLSKYTGKVMPKLTDGRYKQMQIADDLSVRVFSQEKNDFGELEEFSSGTQRQMLLAVRLAMSKALIEATEQKRQFIILDEPFAFFDRERIKATQAALPKVDKHLDQIWIITQEFDDINPFSLHIECSRDSDEMIVGEFSND